MAWYVDIMEFRPSGQDDGVETADRIEKTIGPIASERTADRIDHAVNLNLNHARFYTRVREGK